MMLVKRSLLALCAVAALGAGSAQAHHSFSMFDRTKTASVAGTVKAFDMINPHGWLQLMVADGQGKLREWSLETGAPGQLQRAGWKDQTVVPGDKVTATIHPLKDGSNGGQLVAVVLPNGQTMRAGPDGPGGRGGPGGGQ